MQTQKQRTTKPVEGEEEQQTPETVDATDPELDKLLDDIEEILDDPESDEVFVAFEDSLLDEIDLLLEESEREEILQNYRQWNGE